MTFVVCTVQCIHDYNSPHEHLHTLIPKKGRILSSSLGSALSRVFFFLFLNGFSICSASEHLIMLQYSVSKARKMHLEYSSVYINSNEKNTLMAHKSRRCLHIFLCVSILQISHLFCFTWYSFDCFSFYATIMCELPKNALYTVCRYAPLLFFCIFEFGQ